MTQPTQQVLNERDASLRALLAHVALGDRRAFAQLYQASSAFLFGIILRINKDRAQAEDLLQETFVNVWKSAQSFDAQRSQPLTWMASLARHKAIDSLRRARSEPTLHAQTHSVDGDVEEDELAGVPSPNAGPLQLLQDAAEARELSRCVDRLSAQQQQCVALSYYQGLSHAEVAEHLMAPLGSVKSWVRRALVTLKSCLDRALGQEQVGA